MSAKRYTFVFITTTGGLKIKYFYLTKQNGKGNNYGKAWLKKTGGHGLYLQDELICNWKMVMWFCN